MTPPATERPRLPWDEVAEAVKVPHDRLGLIVFVTTLDGRTFELTTQQFAALVTDGLRDGSDHGV